MERFKICEKETKTKAFSKEALGQQPKSDPREKAKSETRDWINNVMHLEASITRHKAHIMKLELILRLLDNDELSPEQVNDVKDFLDGYLERNQEDFDDFSDVNELYSSLPLEVEALEDLVAVGQPSHVKGSKPQQGAAASISAISLKNSLPSSSSHASAVIAPPQQSVSPLEHISVDVRPKTPTSKVIAGQTLSQASSDV